jgi:hypothetical protein
MFKVAEHVAIKVEPDHIVMNGYRFNRAVDFPIPDRFDVFPATRPDEKGHPRPFSFKNKLQEYLAEPPKNANKADMATPSKPPI